MNPDESLPQQQHQRDVHAATVAEISGLAGGLAHELRNPLSTVMVNLKLLAEDLQDQDADPQDVRRRALLKVDVLRGEAQRLQNLFDDFLNLTGPCRVDKKNIDINTIMQKMVTFFEPLAHNHRIQLQLELAASPLMCQVDDELLSQALLNIVVNAQQAMPEGGQITIAIKDCGDHIELSVTDNGVGIAPEDQERILKPFYSTKRSGTGLGLSITHRLIQAQGGKLEFTTELGKGTTFTISLPRETPSA